MTSFSFCFCVWLLHVIQKCCYTSRTRDAGTHTHGASSSCVTACPAFWNMSWNTRGGGGAGQGEKEAIQWSRRAQSCKYNSAGTHKLTHVSGLKVVHVEALGFWQLATSGRAERLPSRPDDSLKGKAADNTESAYAFNANCPSACTFWADFVTSLDFVLFVHVKPEAAGAHSQLAVNTFKKYPVSPFFGSFYGYYKSTKILYDLWIPDMYGRIILLGKKQISWQQHIILVYTAHANWYLVY